MTTTNGRAFNEWLRAQLKAKKMSQRQLAQQSGVDHSTISRLIRGDRMPSLGTATKLARGLRELRDDADTPQYLGLMSSGAANPTARVEYALRADEVLSEPQVRQIMEYYLAVRMRRLGRAYLGGEAARPAQSPYLRGTPSAGSPIGAGIGIATQPRVSQGRPALRPSSTNGHDSAATVVQRYVAPTDVDFVAHHRAAAAADRLAGVPAPRTSSTTIR